MSLQEVVRRTVAIVGKQSLALCTGSQEWGQNSQHLHLSCLSALSYRLAAPFTAPEKPVWRVVTSAAAGVASSVQSDEGKCKSGRLWLELISHPKEATLLA
ncbi:unnamed protein product [Caretta caretta]